MTHAVMSSATALMIRLSSKNTIGPRSPSRPLSQLRLCLLQPVGHPHLAVHRRRGGEVLLRRRPLAQFNELPTSGEPKARTLYLLHRCPDLTKLLEQSLLILRGDGDPSGAR
jgi:hypothetical protein